jgi:hypothetical protein
MARDPEASVNGREENGASGWCWDVVGLPQMHSALLPQQVEGLDAIIVLGCDVLWREVLMSDLCWGEVKRAK